MDELKEITKQRDELQATVAARNVEVDAWMKSCAEADHRAASAEAQRDELLAALREYGRHKASCKRHVHMLYACDCGLNAAIARAEGKKDE